MDTPRASDLAGAHADDERLVRACLGGDGAAWRELVGRYGRLVLAVPRHYGLSAADADDVFQAVFAALLSQLPHLHNQRGLAKWLITTAHRITWRHFRRQDRAQSLDGHDVPAEDAPAEDAMRWERQHAVRHAIRRLGGRCEELLTALYLAGPDPGYDEVARRLGIPRGSIGPTRSRCLAKLLAILEGEQTA